LGRCKQKQRRLRDYYVAGPPLLNGRCTSLLRAPVSEMTYTVSSGTLNPSIPYLSVTRRYCIKTAKPTLKFFQPSGSPIILVSSDTALIPNSKVKYTGVGKIGDFRRKWCEIGRWLLWNVNRKSWVPDSMVLFSMTLSDHLTRVSRSLYTYKSNISKMVRFMDKTYTIYRIVPLLTLGDL